MSFKKVNIKIPCIRLFLSLDILAPMNPTILKGPCGAVGCMSDL